VFAVVRLGQAEIGQEGPASAIKQDVAGFDIAVDDMSLVDGGQGVGNLDNQGDGFPGILEPAPAAEVLAQALAFHESHDDKRSAGVLADIVDGANVGVADRGGRPGLAQETLAGRSLNGIGATKARDLDGHVAPQVGIMSPADDSHAAGAQAAENLVAAQPVG
jgi:hypothetical protein